MARSRCLLPDWIFSAPGKRRVLELLITQPGRPWTRTELARAAGQHEKARMDLYLRPLIQAEVLTRVGAQYRLAPAHPLVEPLRQLLRALAELPEDELER